MRAPATHPPRARRQASRLLAQDETVFYARAVEAQLRFDGADSSHVVLHQNGQQIRAPNL